MDALHRVIKVEVTRNEPLNIRGLFTECGEMYVGQQLLPEKFSNSSINQSSIRPTDALYIPTTPRHRRPLITLLNSPISKVLIVQQNSSQSQESMSSLSQSILGLSVSIAL